jgi:hypothetical protein
MANIETDVLIVGTAPAGSVTAAPLASYGVANMVVNRYRWLSTTPRARITNQRTMEVLRGHRHIKFAWSMPNGGSWSKVMLKGLRLSRCSKRSTPRFVHGAFHLRTVDPGDDETGWRSDRGWREIPERQCHGKGGVFQFGR